MLFFQTTLALALVAFAVALPVARHSEDPDYRVASDACISHGDRGQFEAGTGHYTSPNGLEYDSFLYFLTDCLAQNGPDGMSQGPAQGSGGHCDSPSPSPSSSTPPTSDQAPSSNGSDASPSPAETQTSPPPQDSPSSNGGSSGDAPAPSQPSEGSSQSSDPPQSNGDASTPSNDASNNNANGGAQGQGVQGEGAGSQNGDGQNKGDCKDAICLSVGTNLESIGGDSRDSDDASNQDGDASNQSGDLSNLLNENGDGANSNNHGQSSECKDAICLGLDTNYESKDIEAEYVGVSLDHLDTNTDYDVVGESNKYDYTVLY